MMSGKCAAQTDIAPLSVLFLEVPLALFAPAKARGAERGHQFTRQFIISDGLPVGIVRFPQAAGYIRRAQQPVGDQPAVTLRSEEHTSELQSLMRISYAVFCLKKKKINTRTATCSVTIMYKDKL